jgi:hypothetical protein
MPKQSKPTLNSVLTEWENEFRAVVTKNHYFQLPGINSQDDQTQKIGKTVLERQVLFIKALVDYHAYPWRTIDEIRIFLNRQIDAIVAPERKKPAFAVELLRKKNPRGRIIHVDNLEDINFGKVWYLFAYDKIIISNRRWNHLTFYQISDAVQAVQDGFDLKMGASFEFEAGQAWQHWVNPITIICHIGKNCRAIFRRRFEKRLIRKMRGEEDDFEVDTSEPVQAKRKRQTMNTQELLCRPLSKNRS